MYYFDNKFLQQYIDTGAKLQVYYDSEWYNISDLIDLHNATEAVGYDEYGESKTIPYKQIELIQVNGSVITIDNLQTMMTGKETEDDSKTKKPSSDSEEPDMNADDEKPRDNEKEPDLSWYSPHYDLGRLILKESTKK